MGRRSLLLLIALLIAIGAAFLLLSRDSDSPQTSNADGEPTEAYAPLIEARDTLLSTPQKVTLDLAIDIPKGSSSENPDHQEISAEGEINFSDGQAELVYDYQGLANAAGFLGHFDTMQVLYSDGTGYLDVFKSGPRWLSIEPSNAGEAEVDRLRDVMLTTPLMLPGLVEAAASSPVGESGELSRVVDPSVLTTTSDELAAGLGAVYEELAVESILVEVAIEDGKLIEVVLSFDYTAAQGRNDVKVTYQLEDFDEEVSVEAPAENDVREFSSIFG